MVKLIKKEKRNIWIFVGVILFIILAANNFDISQIFSVVIQGSGGGSSAGGVGTIG